MEEKNTNVSLTEENPEQNSPEISAENESVTEAAKASIKTAVPKWLIVIIAAMAAVIIGLSVTLAVILAGGKTVDESSSSQSGTSADNGVGVMNEFSSQLLGYFDRQLAGRCNGRWHHPAIFRR